MFTHIVVAIDESGCARRALELAISLARSEKARLTVCHVIDPLQAVPVIADPYATAQPWLDALYDEGTALLLQAQQRASAAGVQVETTLLDGNPITTIVDLARREACDLIALGSHGRSGLSRLLVGSVAEGVMRASSAPTLVVHETAPTHAHVPSHATTASTAPAPPESEPSAPTTSA